MSAIKDGRYSLELGGKPRYLLFSLNALDEIQDRFGGYDKLADAFDQKKPDWVKNTKWLLTLLINEGRGEGEEEVTENEVGRWIHIGNISEVQNAILKSFAKGINGSTELTTEEENVGNQVSGLMK